MTDVEHSERENVLKEMAKAESVYAKMRSQALFAQIVKVSDRHGKRGISTVRASRIRSEIGNMIQELESRLPTPRSEWEQMEKDLRS